MKQVPWPARGLFKDDLDGGADRSAAKPGISQEISELGKVIERELAVINGLGLHARVAARIAETIKQYECTVILSKDGLEAEGDSVLSILTLDAPAGSRLLARAQGEQAEAVLGALEELFAKRFGEEQ